MSSITRNMTYENDYKNLCLPLYIVRPLVFLVVTNIFEDNISCISTSGLDSVVWMSNQSLFSIASYIGTSNIARTQKVHGNLVLRIHTAALVGINVDDVIIWGRNKSKWSVQRSPQRNAIRCVSRDWRAGDILQEIGGKGHRHSNKIKHINI